MQPHTTSEAFVASMFGVLLAACSPARHIAPPGHEELTGFVLAIRELPDGSIIHTWQHAEDAGLSLSSLSAEYPSSARPIMLAMSHARDCDDWLKRHRKSLLVGSVVVIAGVAFVVVTAGAGLVVLAPAVLLASSGAPLDSCIAVVSP